VVMGNPVLNMVDDEVDDFKRHLGILVVVMCSGLMNCMNCI
jgi:hypothetical protein